MKTAKRATALGFSALASLWSTGALAGVGPAIDELFNQATGDGEFTVHATYDTYGFAVANDDAVSSLPNNVMDWNSLIVDIEDWSSFTFNGAEGWSPPDTTLPANAFDTLFPGGFSQVIVYWETAPLLGPPDPILDGASQNGWLFSTIEASSPYIVIDIGGNIDTGNTNLTIIPLPAAGFVLGAGLSALVGFTRRKSA